MLRTTRPLRRPIIPSRWTTATCAHGRAFVVRSGEADDHLSLVAGISRLQRRELEARSIPTLASLAEMPLPLTFKPKRGATATFERVREQARVQLGARETQQAVYEVIQPIEPERGLCRLPEPSPTTYFWISKAIRSPAKADESTYLAS